MYGFYLLSFQRPSFETLATETVMVCLKHVVICLFQVNVLKVGCETFPMKHRTRIEDAFEPSMYTRLVSNSAPAWSSGCCFTACHF